MASDGIMPIDAAAGTTVGSVECCSHHRCNCGGKFLPWAELSSAVPLRRWVRNRLQVSSSHSFGLYHKSTLAISIGPLVGRSGSKHLRGYMNKNNFSADNMPRKKGHAYARSAGHYPQ